MIMEHTQIARMMGGLIGSENLEDLIMCLPDEFFLLNDLGKSLAWTAAHHAAIEGERDPEKLAGEVHKFITSILPKMRTPA